MRVSDYLDKKGFEYDIKERPSGQNYIMICPFCNGGKDKRKTFAINANSGLWNCIRKEDCNKSGTFYQLQEQLGDKPIKIDPFIKSKDKDKKYNIPKIIKLPLNISNIEYLKNERKFTDEIIKKFDIFEGLKGEICFPYYKNNTIVNIKHRNRHDKKMWQSNNAEPTLFNINNVKGNDILSITEGECDCVALVQYGIQNVVSIPSGVNDLRWIENDWNFLEKFEEIYIIMDQDEAGQEAVKKIVNRLGLWRCKSITLPYKDPNECLINNVSNKEILHCFENAIEFTPPEIRSAGDYTEEVIDIFEHPDRYKGLDTGFPELTKIIKGWRKGEVTIWSGQGHSGKTTILNQSCLYLGSGGIKCCIASLELRPARYLKWAVEQTLGKDNPTKEEIIKVFEWMQDWLFVLNIEGNTYGSKIFELFEYTARKHGAEIFIIDSLMKIRLKGQDEGMSQVEFVNDLTVFVKKFNVHCHLVAHSRKQESDKSKPDKSAVKGRGEITDLADNVIIMWRNEDSNKEDLEEEERYDALMIIKKNREFGEIGYIPLYFDEKSRRFLCKNQHSFFK